MDCVYLVVLFTIFLILIVLYTIFMLLGFCTICVVLLVASAMWIKHVRNKHLSEIRKRNLYFGVHGEVYSLLKRMAKYVKEVIQLNMITAILIMVGCVCRVLMFYYPGVRMLKVVSSVSTLVYTITNPVVYLFVMVDLRKCYKKLFRKCSCCRKLASRIHPALVVTVSP